jgi:exopolysaccharide biosynthesis polyprenyl glycosylphosphotransferase
MDGISTERADAGPILSVIGERAHTLRPGAGSTLIDRPAVLVRRLLLGDLLAALISGLTAATLAGGDAVSVAVTGAGVLALWPLVAAVCGLYTAADLGSWASGVASASKLAFAFLALSWPVYALSLALHTPHPATAAMTASLVCAVTAASARSAVRLWTHRSTRLRQRTLIVGSGSVADKLIARLERHVELSLDPVGFIDDDVYGNGVGSLPQLGGLADLPHVIETFGIQRVMIAFTRAGHEELLHCIRTCRDAGIDVDVVPRLYEFLDGARTLDQIGGMPLLSISTPSFSAPARAAKRGLDIIASLITLLTLAPLLAVVAVAIKLDSPGPVFFVQARTGRHGKLFRLYKFRSMRIGSSMLVRQDGVIVKSRDDARITRVGRLLRRFSIDEMPQLFNVLKGDMSLVGPRPLVISEAEALDQLWHVRRADLRPGLTGPWQISGRSHIAFDEMLRFDYQYVAGWSLARDIEILLATIPAVVTGRGAY